jgi:hypothetical protein
MVDAVIRPWPRWQSGRAVVGMRRRDREGLFLNALGAVMWHDLDCEINIFCELAPWMVVAIGFIKVEHICIALRSKKLRGLQQKI